MTIDTAVIERAQRGDEAAFCEIIQTYKRRIFSTLYRVIGPRDDVEDVAQDVFVRLHQSLGQLRSPEVFETWLYRLTQHAAYDYLRRKMRHDHLRMSDLSDEQERVAEALASGLAYSNEAHNQEIRDFVDFLLSQVSPKDRVLLMMKEVEGRSLKELSDIYDCNINAIKVRLFRARKRVLEAYEQACEKAREEGRPDLPLEVAPAGLGVLA